MAVSEPWTQWCLKIKTIIAVDKQADTDTRGGVVQTLPPPPRLGFQARSRVA